MESEQTTENVNTKSDIGLFVNASWGTFWSDALVD